MCELWQNFNVGTKVYPNMLNISVCDYILSEIGHFMQIVVWQCKNVQAACLSHWWWISSSWQPIVVYHPRPLLLEERISWKSKEKIKKLFGRKIENGVKGKHMLFDKQNSLSSTRVVLEDLQRRKDNKDEYLCCDDSIMRKVLSKQMNNLICSELDCWVLLSCQRSHATLIVVLLTFSYPGNNT